MSEARDAGRLRVDPEGKMTPAEIAAFNLGWKAAHKRRGRPMLDYINMHTKEENGCWTFTGRLNGKGYGECASQGLAHRFYYEKLVGPIPFGLSIDHLCRNTSCVNPQHLEPVTIAENNRRRGVTRPKQPQCKQGHAYTVENTYIDRAGAQVCRTCSNAHGRAWRARQRG